MKNKSILAISFSFILLIMGVIQTATAQPSTQARLPGANNEDVEWCKSVIDDPFWSTVYSNLGKCANMTPADFQFICRTLVEAELFKNKGECMRFFLSFRDIP